MSFSSHPMNRNMWRGLDWPLFCLLGLLSFWTGFVSLKALASENAKKFYFTSLKSILLSYFITHPTS